MKPPADADLPAHELWAAIIAMPRPFRVVPFPRRGPDGEPVAEMAMQVLTQEECIAAKASAERYVRKLLREKDNGATSPESGQGYADLCELRDSVELLFRSCRRVDDMTRPFFPTVEAVGKHLLTDEIGVLVLNYRRVQMEIGPIVNDMSQEEMDAWISVLAKGGSQFPFDMLSLGQQTQLFRHLARRLLLSQTDNSSPGEPREETI